MDGQPLTLIIDYGTLFGMMTKYAHFRSISNRHLLPNNKWKEGKNLVNIWLQLIEREGKSSS